MRKGRKQHRAIRQQRVDRIELRDAAFSPLELWFETPHRRFHYRVFEEVDLRIDFDQRADTTVESLVVFGWQLTQRADCEHQQRKFHRWILGCDENLHLKRLFFALLTENLRDTGAL